MLDYQDLCRGPLDVASYLYLSAEGLMFSEDDFLRFPIINLRELYVAMATRVPTGSAHKPLAAISPTWRYFTRTLIAISYLTLKIHFFENVNRWPRTIAILIPHLAEVS